MPLTRSALLAALAVLAATCGCLKFGQVNEGRVIAYDQERGLVTLISDSNFKDPSRPSYDVLPPVTVKAPEDPGEMGPPPVAGKLMSIDTAARRITFFDAASQSFRTVEYQPVEAQSAVPAGGPFPAVDRQRKMVTLQLPRQKRLLAFTLPEELLALPEDTWSMGDVVRYYYKEPGRALRMMNVTRTDLSKKGE